jgi:hypothetical protein
MPVVAKRDAIGISFITASGALVNTIPIPAFPLKGKE